MINMIRMKRIGKTWRLHHIDIFIKSDMKESIIDIKLSNRPSKSDCKGENKSNSGGLYNGTKLM